jgi:hypothetical protein
MAEIDSDPRPAILAATFERRLIFNREDCALENEVELAPGSIRVALAAGQRHLPHRSVPWGT